MYCYISFYAVSSVSINEETKRFLYKTWKLLVKNLRLLFVIGLLRKDNYEYLKKAISQINRTICFAKRNFVDDIPFINDFSNSE